MSLVGTKRTADSLSFLVRALQEPIVGLGEGPNPLFLPPHFFILQKLFENLRLVRGKIIINKLRFILSYFTRATHEILCARLIKLLYIHQSFATLPIIIIWEAIVKYG